MMGRLGANCFAARLNKPVSTTHTYAKVLTFLMLLCCYTEELTVARENR